MSLGTMPESRVFWIASRSFSASWRLPRSWKKKTVERSQRTTKTITAGVRAGRDPCCGKGGGIRDLQIGRWETWCGRNLFSYTTPRARKSDVREANQQGPKWRPVRYNNPAKQESNIKGKPSAAGSRRDVYHLFGWEFTVMG